MEIVIFVGIQASGKSTFYRQNLSHGYLRISLDMLKTRHREMRLMETCFEIKQPFVVDNTNPTVEERARYIAMAKAQECKVRGYYFESKIAESIRRNQSRSGKQRIPEKGIRGTHARLVLPSYAEGLDELYYVKIRPTHSFAVQAWKDEV